jgi:gluconokinase
MTKEKEEDPSNINNNIFPPPGLFCYRIHSNLLLLGGAISDGGSIIEWIRNLFHLTTDESFITCLEQVKKLYQQKSKEQQQQQQDSSLYNNTSRMIEPPLLFIPFLSGERSTGFRPGATGSFIGLTRYTSQEDFVLSSMEGVILRLSTILKLMEPIQSQFQQNLLSISNTTTTTNTQPMIIVSGTALDRNELWRQMLSDCTQKIVVMDPDCIEGSSRGVAILLAQELLFKTQGKNETQHMNIIEGIDLSHCKISQYDVETHSYWSKVSVLQENAITHIAPFWDTK